MQISVDGEFLFEINANQIEILGYLMSSSQIEAEVKRRLEWVITHKIDQTHAHLKEAWMPILEADPKVTHIPIQRQAFFDMIKGRPDYKDRDARIDQENP